MEMLLLFTSESIYDRGKLIPTHLFLNSLDQDVKLIRNCVVVEDVVRFFRPPAPSGLSGISGICPIHFNWKFNSK